MQNNREIETETGLDTKTPQTSEANTLRDLDELIASAKRGDQTALNRLLAHARPKLLSVALRMVRDRDEAEDVVQESLIKVCRYLTRFEGRSAFSTWLHRIVVNASLDRIRRQQSHGGRMSDAPSGSDRAHDAFESVNDETPERLYVRAQASAVVHGALAQLSPAHREALVLREIEGESYQAIADVVHCPVGTVMSRLHHARHRLAEQLLSSVSTAAPQAA
jgi:RNA polymerase sigma-70 factor (ECF subfamily)